METFKRFLAHLKEVKFEITIKAWHQFFISTKIMWTVSILKTGSQLLDADLDFHCSPSPFFSIFFFDFVTTNFRDFQHLFWGRRGSRRDYFNEVATGCVQVEISAYCPQ